SVILKMMCVLLCAVFVSAEVMPMTDFDLDKMSGKWYIIGMATNAEWFVSHKANKKMGTAMLVPTEDGDLDLSYANLNDDGSCWRMSHLANKTETPARFVFTSQRWGNDNDMRVVDARFDEYAFIHTIKTKEGVSELLNALYSRNTTVTEDLVEKFKNFSLDIGILEENILILPANEECPSA
ncbi:lipocalin-type prostaglandin D synthase-like protein, partial [Triplophysa rosa]